MTEREGVAHLEVAAELNMLPEYGSREVTLLPLAEDMSGKPTAAQINEVLERVLAGEMDPGTADQEDDDLPPAALAKDEDPEEDGACEGEASTSNSNSSSTSSSSSESSQSSSTDKGKKKDKKRKGKKKKKDKRGKASSKTKKDKATAAGAATEAKTVKETKAKPAKAKQPPKAKAAKAKPATKGAACSVLLVVFSVWMRFASLMQVPQQRESLSRLILQRSS